MAFLADASAKGGGIDPIPAAKKSRFFSKYNKKCLECSETKEYA